MTESKTGARLDEPRADAHAPDDRRRRDMALRLEMLRAEKAARDEAREAKRLAYEIEELELEARFEAELGPKGIAWNILDLTNLGEGFVVVRPGETKAHKRFTGAISRVKDGQSIPDETFVAYVLPALAHPMEKEFLAIANRRHEVWPRTANAIGDLQGFVQRDNAGKY